MVSVVSSTNNFLSSSSHIAVRPAKYIINLNKSSMVYYPIKTYKINKYRVTAHLIIFSSIFVRFSNAGPQEGKTVCWAKCGENWHRNIGQFLFANMAVSTLV